MKFHFSGQILSENGELKINIPFNVWEVCDSQGVLMISVCLLYTSDAADE